MTPQGLMIIYTGDGKGKTTAAFGQAFRAAGHGMQVCIIQFIKGNWRTGEAASVERMADQIELHVKGTGFTWQAGSLEEIKTAALDGWRLALEKINSDRFDMVVLDELTYLISHQILSEAEVLAALKHRPARLHMVITGRGASAGLIDAADLVTEMRLVKHPYQAGISAQKGIEF